MKFIFIFIYFLSSHLQASCAANTAALFNFENNANDSCGSNNLTQNGSVPYLTSNPAPYQGIYSAGSFSDSVNFTGGSGLQTAMSGLTTWSVEGAVYFNNLANQGVFLTMGNATWADAILLRSLNTGTLRLVINDVAHDSSAGALTSGAWYYVAVEWDGVNTNVYANLTGSATTKIITVAGNPNLGTVNSIRLGDFPTLPANVQLDAWRFNSISRNGSYPTTDGFTPTATPTATPVFSPTTTPTITATFTPYQTFTPNMSYTPAPYNGLNSVPPMAWNSFIPFGFSVTEAEVTSTAKAMYNKGLAALGWNVEIDGGWKGGRDMSGNLYPDPVAFPDGMAYVANIVHGFGMKFYLYTSQAEQDCAEAVGTGSGGHEIQDAATWRSWNVDGVYNDYCNPDQRNPRDANITMWNAFITGGYPMTVFSGGPQNFDSSDFSYLPWEPFVSNGWRVWADGSDSYGNSLLRSYRALSVNANAFSGSYVDVGGTTAGQGGQTLDQYKTDYALNCMVPVAMWINTDINSIASNILALFTNTTALSIAEDVGVKRGVKTQDNGVGQYVIIRPLTPRGKWAFLLVNEDVTSKTITANFDTNLVNYPSFYNYYYTETATAYNVYDGGFVTNNVGSYSAIVPPTACVWITLQFGDYISSYPGNDAPDDSSKLLLNNLLSPLN